MTQLFVDGLFGALKAGFVPASGGGTTTFLRADGAWAATGGGGATLADGDYGDVTVSGTGTVLPVDALPERRITGLVADLAAKVPNGRTLTCTAPLTIGGGASADLSADRTLAIVAFTPAVAGAVTASSAAANVLRGDNTWSTIAQLTAALNLFSSSLQGLVPASPGGTPTFLRADGTWAAPLVAFFDTVIDMTGTPISFGATYDNWNVGTIGQNTLIKYITDGTPTGTKFIKDDGLFLVDAHDVVGSRSGDGIGVPVRVVFVSVAPTAFSHRHLVCPLSRNQNCRFHF